jgi:transposase InsO family protein
LGLTLNNLDRLVRQNGWRRPRLRVHPAKPRIGLRTTRADEMWHIDTTVIRLLDGTRAYLRAVIDNFSRRILAWRVGTPPKCLMHWRERVGRNRNDRKRWNGLRSVAHPPHAAIGVLG